MTTGVHTSTGMDTGTGVAQIVMGVARIQVRTFYRYKYGCCTDTIMGVCMDVEQ